MDDNYITEQTGNEQTLEPDNVQALKANRRNRIAIYVSLTLSVIGIAVLLGVVLGKIILDIII